MQIADASFVITDTETTGLKASADRVIEIGAVKVRGGEVVDRFAQLVNPGRTISRRITQITGITTGMVYDQPVMSDVLPEYMAFLGDGIFVAHNASFDQRFLDAALRRNGGSSLSNDVLCTMRLARRLLPGLKSKSLSALRIFYGISTRDQHRAMSDAEATGRVLTRLLSQLAFEHDITCVRDLLAFQRKRYSRIRKPPSHIRSIRTRVLPELPKQPGVYFIKSSSGATLYIGKAKNLRERVRSHLTAIESHEARRRTLIRKTRCITWRETPSELDALLLESRLIKSEKPPYNRAGRRYRTRPFLRLDTSEPYPTITSTLYLQDDDAEYFGPLRSKAEAQFVLDLLGRFFQLRECENQRLRQGQRCLYANLERCTAPCEGGPGARVYEDVVERVRSFLLGHDREVLDELDQAMHHAARQMRYERAATYRDWRERLQRLLMKQQFVAAPVRDHHAVLVQLADELIRFIAVRHGRHVETVVSERPVAGCPDVLTGLVQRAFGSDQPRPGRLTKREVHEIRLLSHWMYLRREEIRHIRWQPGADTSEFLQVILDATESSESA